jgi:hypothetical protein
MSVIWLTCPACKARYPTAKDRDASGDILCRCGVQFPRNSNFVEVPPPPPSVVQKGKNYISAWIRWRVAGRPLREPEEVEQLREICKACTEYYDNGTCNHPKCGCGVGESGWLGDKLAWESEHCPIKKW